MSDDQYRAEHLDTLENENTDKSVNPPVMVRGMMVKINGSWVYWNSGVNNSIVAERKVVTTAGTAVPLIATSTACKRVVVCAETDNTGIIAIGDSSVVAAEGSQRGIPLFPGDKIEIDIDDVSKIYIDSTVNGDGVTFFYLK